VYAQLSYTTQHGAVLITFPLIFQTSITAQILSTGGEEVLKITETGSLCLTNQTALSKYFRFCLISLLFGDSLGWAGFFQRESLHTVGGQTPFLPSNQPSKNTEGRRNIRAATVLNLLHQTKNEDQKFKQESKFVAII